MRYSNYRFTLDLQKHQSQMSIAVFKNDTAVRLRISLTDGGKSYFIDNGCIAKFFATRSDDKELIHNCMIEGNTEIVYDFQPSTSCREGITNCQIRLYGLDGLLIAAPRFIIVVDERVVIDELVDLPEDNLSGIDALLLLEAERVNNEANRVASEAIRVANEDNRAESEDIRITNEADRQNAESGRAANELARIENEVARQQAESNRGKRLTALEDNAVLKDSDYTQFVQSDIEFAGKVSAQNVSAADAVYLNDEGISLKNERGILFDGFYGGYPVAKILPLLVRDEGNNEDYVGGFRFVGEKHEFIGDITFKKAIKLDSGHSIKGNANFLNGISVGGDVDVKGNLNIEGKTVTKDHETLLVKDNIIVVNSDSASFSQAGLVICLGDDVGYGILHQGEEMYIGRGKITHSDEEGVEFVFTYDEGAPRRISALDPDSEFLHGDIPIFDADKSAFVTSGISTSELATKREIGDIESSLDAILAIQASLIGGES